MIYRKFSESSLLWDNNPFNECSAILSVILHGFSGSLVPGRPGTEARVSGNYAESILVLYLL